MNEEFKIDFEEEEEKEKQVIEETSDTGIPTVEIVDVDKKKHELSNKRNHPFQLNQNNDPMIQYGAHLGLGNLNI
jgi:hypothetical protein